MTRGRCIVVWPECFFKSLVPTIVIGVATSWTVTSIRLQEQPRTNARRTLADKTVGAKTFPVVSSASAHPVARAIRASGVYANRPSKGRTLAKASCAASTPCVNRWTTKTPNAIVLPSTRWAIRTSNVSERTRRVREPTWAPGRKRRIEGGEAMDGREVTENRRAFLRQTIRPNEYEHGRKRTFLSFYPFLATPGTVPAQSRFEVKKYGIIFFSDPVLSAGGGKACRKSETFGSPTARFPVFRCLRLTPDDGSERLFFPNNLGYGLFFIYVLETGPPLTISTSQCQGEGRGCS